jgi:hypothetical protein
MQDEEDNNQ